MGVDLRGEEAHQVDDVDEAGAKLGNVLAQQLCGGQRLQGRDVAGAAEDDVGVLVTPIAGPLPAGGAGGGVGSRLLVGEVLQKDVELRVGPHLGSLDGP